MSSKTKVVVAVFADIIAIITPLAGLLNYPWAIVVSLSIILVVTLIVSHSIYKNAIEKADAAYREVIEKADKYLILNHSGDYKKFTYCGCFTSDDGCKGRFDVTRVIQSKRPELVEYKERFKWHGKGYPKISGNHKHDIDNIVKSNDPGIFDEMRIVFDNPLSFNESTVLRTSYEGNYHDCSPVFCIPVKEPIQLIQFRISLGFKNKGNVSPAKLEKRRIGQNVSGQMTLVSEISFDKQHRTYEYELLNPDVGYEYRLSWDK